jgi:hypothetical protein
MPGTGHDTHELLLEAMDWFEKAERIRPSHNDDALLRWNACVRLIASNRLEARPAEHVGTTSE